jgi:hypothetical protein
LPRHLHPGRSRRFPADKWWISGRQVVRKDWIITDFFGNMPSCRGWVTTPTCGTRSRPNTVLRRLRWRKRSRRLGRRSGVRGVRARRRGGDAGESGRGLGADSPRAEGDEPGRVDGCGTGCRLSQENAKDVQEHRRDRGDPQALSHGARYPLQPQRTRRVAHEPVGTGRHRIAGFLVFLKRAESCASLMDRRRRSRGAHGRVMLR